MTRANDSELYLFIFALDVQGVLACVGEFEDGYNFRKLDSKCKESPVKVDGNWVTILRKDSITLLSFHTLDPLGKKKSLGLGLLLWDSFVWVQGGQITPNRYPFFRAINSTDPFFTFAAELRKLSIDDKLIIYQRYNDDITTR